MTARPAASPDFRFDTGRLSLDLVATVGARLSGAPVERMTGPDRLALWLATTDLVAVDEAVVEPAWVDAFVDLRALLHRLVHARVDDRAPDPGDLDRLNALAAGPRRPRRLAADWTVRAGGAPSLDHALAAVAADAVDLLGGADADRLHVCEGPTCDLVFVDTSRAQRRRWCSNGACGNRSRVASHRRRQSNGS
ncbi:CGNR zinc finger domain-containing protein [Nocardioides sp. LML1-1-1.1]|uniref:CGNR zinc finger domain-containing protein n=1 Tax=Nocardioides sp. LML1-1-1.1 TaxID=3135248 RepID=UPI00341276DF